MRRYEIGGDWVKHSFVAENGIWAFTCMQIMRNIQVSGTLESIYIPGNLKKARSSHEKVLQQLLQDKRKCSFPYFTRSSRHYMKQKGRLGNKGRTEEFNKKVEFDSEKPPYHCFVCIA